MELRAEGRRMKQHQAMLIKWNASFSDVWALDQQDKLHFEAW